MIIKEEKGGLIYRHSDDERMLLHKIGTEQYYTSTIDIPEATWEYEEVEDPDYDRKKEERERYELERKMRELEAKRRSRVIQETPVE